MKARMESVTHIYALASPYIALTLVGLVFAGFISERHPPSVTASAGAASFLGFGFLSVDEALAVFSNSAPITIAAMFIVSGALIRTGALEAASTRLLELAQTKPHAAIVLLFLGAFAASAFMNNTPVIIVLIPVVSAVAAQVGWSKRTLLMPLSFVAILGGTTTLLGTSSNLIVDGVARRAGEPGFGVFDITLVGLVASLAGGVMLFLFKNRLRFNEENDDHATHFKNEIITRLRVTETASCLNQTLPEVKALAPRGITILSISRGSNSYPLDSEFRLRAGDTIDARVSEAELLTLLTNTDFDIGVKARALREEMSELAAITISPDNRDIGEPIAETSFVSRYSLAVVGALRPGRLAGPDIKGMRLRAGDRLYIRSSADTLRSLRDASYIIASDQIMARAFRRGRLAEATFILVAIVSLASFGVMPIAGLAIIGAVALLFRRCIDPGEAWQSFDGDVLVLIFAMLMIGTGLQNTGAISLIVDAVEPLLQSTSPLAVIISIYALTSLLTELVTNNAVAVIMTPIAIALAASLGLDPRALIVAVMFAASASFATPVGYQTNTLVYSAGNYSFMDFIRIGLPMNIVVGLATCLTVYALFAV